MEGENVARVLARRVVPLKMFGLVLSESHNSGVHDGREIELHGRGAICFTFAGFCAR